MAISHLHAKFRVQVSAGHKTLFFCFRHKALRSKLVFFQPNPEFRPAEADISKKPPFTRHPLERLYSAWADKFVIKNLDLNVEGNKTEIYNKALTNHYSTMGSLIPMKRETILESYENRQDVLAENPSQLVSFSGLLNFIVNA